MIFIKKLLLFSIIILIISTTFFLVKANDYSLFGYVILLDPGHGGKDNGAEVNNVLEDEINLSIAKILYQKLFDQGCIVHVTRSGDYDLAPLDSQTRKMKDLKRRTRFINEVDADLFISIHLNIFIQEQVKGIQVFYQQYKDESKKLAKSLQNEFNRLINEKNKKPKIGDYYILNNTYPTGVLIECGFLSNDEDRLNLNNHDYQDKICKIIYKGILDFYR